MIYSDLITCVDGQWQLESGVPAHEDQHQPQIKYVLNDDKTLSAFVTITSDTSSGMTIKEELTVPVGSVIKEGAYKVTGVCVLHNCFTNHYYNYALDLTIASTVKTIEIVNVSNGYQSRKPAYGAIRFFVVDGSCGSNVSPYFSHYSSNKGNLYDKMKTTLISFCAKKKCNEDDTFIVPDSVKEISTGAFISKEPYTIILPKLVTRLTKDTFIGNFPELDFTGGLTVIEDGALDGLNDDRTYKLKINGTLSAMTRSSHDVLKNWKNNDTSRYKREVVFAAPEPIHTKMLGNGLIQLSRVLTTEEKLNEHADTTPVVLNAFVSCNNPILLKEHGTLMPIVVDSVTIDKIKGFQGSSWSCPSRFDPLYEDTKVTRISIIQAGLTQTREPFKFVVFVHEPLETVIKMLAEANKQFLKSNE